ncbi:cyclic nucleotide-binding domain protein (macronuclear) [Tetrahymena thermophila SB210]|uniref:Cyclic nucleotide-binding domain protein n=1 Tax=Tetrahymena thermophila (strain SB210) TaxID=312017 RepID=Q236Y8_TETTS|nr:cyclic nucleotide-binding domain protein [Tetrahymena thermophila SB210]EAR92362.2 cyclic nucleotide-binding domain protein [Tetrahymena thermophila SB210]|eukprot:XP_001012607.2 cyclic nucleotide-binding domain protein [Tetrahymena thermophila SB210]
MQSLKYEESSFSPQNPFHSFNAQEHQELNDISRKKDDSVISDRSIQKNIEIIPHIKNEAKSILQSIKNSPIHHIKTSIEASQRFIEASQDINPSQMIIHNRKKGETVISNLTNHDEAIQKQLESKSIKQIQEMKEPRRLMLAINLLVNVKGFYRKVTQNSRLIEKLSREQHNQIGDLSSFFTKNQFSKKVKRLFKFQTAFKNMVAQLNNNTKYIPILAPYSIFKQIWDLIQTILEMIVSFLFSLYIFFQLDVQEYNNLFLICFILFFCDVLVNFNTGILQEGTVIYKRKLIAQEYIKGNFFFDIIGLIPFMNFFWIGGVAYSRREVNTVLMSSLISMKWFSLGANLGKLTFFLSYQKGMKNSLDLIKLIFLMLCVCHSFSLVWHGLAIYEISYLQRDDSWLQQYQILDFNVWVRYCYSFYYLTVTMTTTGYGDITPKNYIEVMFAIGIIFITAIFWAFFLNKIGQIIDNMEEKEKQYTENMLVIHRLMREEEVDKELRVKISNYLKYLYQESNQVQKSKEKEIMDKLSKQLKDDLILDMNGKFIRNIPILEKLESKNKIAQSMEECLFSPGEYIFKQDQLDDSSLYYIAKGSVSIVFESEINFRSQINVIQTLGKQQYFGEIGFLFQSKRAYSAKANNFCRLFKLQRVIFEQIIKQSEHDFENFQMTKESILMKDNYKFQKIRCYTCNQGNHLSHNCPKTHLTISKQVHINRHNYSQPHKERSNFTRCRIKINSLITMVIAHNAVFQINDNVDFFEYLDKIEEGLNLSDQDQDQDFDYSEAYNTDNENYSDHDLNQNHFQKFDEMGSADQEFSRTPVTKSRSLVKKGTANSSVPLQPGRQSIMEQNVMSFQNQQQSIIDEAYHREEESQPSSKSSISSSDQLSDKDQSQYTHTVTNNDTLTSKTGQRQNQEQNIPQIVRKQKSNQTFVRGDSKKLSHNVTGEHSSLANQLKGSQLLPITTILPPTDSQVFNQEYHQNQPNNKRIVSELQPFKDNDSHVGSLTSITSRSRVPSRLVLNEKDNKRNPTTNSFQDQNQLNANNNEQIRSLTKISTHSAREKSPIQNSNVNQNQQQQNANDKKPMKNNSINEIVQSRRSRLSERRSIGRDLQFNNQLQQQLQEMLIRNPTRGNNKKLSKTDIQNMAKQKTRASVSVDKLANQIKMLQNLKGYTTNQTLKSNNDKNNLQKQNTPTNSNNIEEQIMYVLKDQIDLQQIQIGMEEEIRDQTNYLNIQEFDRAFTFKFYYRNDNYLLVVERYQEYWKKMNNLLDKIAKKNKKKTKKRLKSKLGGKQVF